MQRNIQRVVNGTHSVLYSMLVKCAGIFKVSFIVGSQTAFFSLANCVVPLSGAFLGSSGSFLLFLLSSCFRVVVAGFNPFLLLVYHIPGLFASLYWASNKAMIRLWVPLVCMVLFVVHPVGAQAFPYALYWLIPVGIYLSKRDSVWLNSFGSTFVAHAVGSVIWLYAAPMTPAFWLALIPVVLVERVLFASGMVIMHNALSHGLKLMRSVKGAFFIGSNQGHLQ